MGKYKDQVDYQPHSFNSSTLSITDSTGETHIAEGLDTVEAEPTEDEWTSQQVASGTAIMVHNPSKEGTFKFTFLEASTTTDFLVAILNAHEPVSFSFTDENAPNLNCSSGQAFLRKHAIIKRGAEADTPEWEFVCPYMKTEGGSYALQAVA
jgi:hypothetical protein